MAILDYYEALERLIKNEPINIPKNTKINQDTVALEAGRQRGAIKANRSKFDDLIEKINEEKEKEAYLIKKYKKRIEKLEDDRDDYKKKYEEALNRELMLIEKLKS